MLNAIPLGLIRPLSPKTSAASAETAGPRLYRNAQVASYIGKALEKLHERYEVTHERVVQELAAVAFANMGEFAQWGPDGVRTGRR